MESSTALADPATTANIAAASTREQKRTSATIPWIVFMTASVPATILIGFVPLDDEVPSKASRSKSPRAAKVPSRSRQISAQRADQIPHEFVMLRLGRL